MFFISFSGQQHHIKFNMIWPQKGRKSVHRAILQENVQLIFKMAIRNWRSRFTEIW